MKKNNIKDFSISIVSFVLRLFHIKVSEKEKHLLVQIFNFGIVGVISTIIDFLFLYIFRDCCHFPLVISNTLSFIISFLYNYWASMTFVFDVNENKNRKKNFILFLVFSVIGLGLNDFIVWIVTKKLHVYYLISKVIATLFVMVFNFVTRKKFLE